MSKPQSHAVAPAGVLSLQSWESSIAAGPELAAPYKPSQAYLIEVQGDATAQILESVMPMLSRLLSHKSAAVREQKLEELVDFLAGQIVVPSSVDTQMAQRLAVRYARVLGEFGFVTANTWWRFFQLSASALRLPARDWFASANCSAVTKPNSPRTRA